MHHTRARDNLTVVVRAGTRVAEVPDMGLTVVDAGITSRGLRRGSTTTRPRSRAAPRSRSASRSGNHAPNSMTKELQPQYRLYGVVQLCFCFRAALADVS
eukprot:3324567-Rhodomonas_salina.1